MSKPAGSPARRGVLLRIYSRAPGDESGMALVLVVGSMLVLAMLALTALTYTISSQRFARYTQDYTGAMAAAQSGIEDYIAHLNRADHYGDTVDCGNLALQGPMAAASNICGWGPTTAVGWLPVVPGETDPDAAYFHYSVVTTDLTSQGTIVVTATGRVNGEYRTIEAAVGKGGSTDYVYYTDRESADPSNVQAYPPSGATQLLCGAGAYSNSKFFYNGRAGAGCTEITFISSDTLDGAVFSNDSVLSDGASFLDGFTSANPTCATVTSSVSTWNKCLRNNGGYTSTANFDGIQPKLAEEPLYLDDTSAAFAGYPGCHYFGSTRIIFNASGTMTVWNKLVNNGGQAPTASAPPGGTAPTCGELLALDSIDGATVDVPDEMVIYVAGAPASVVRRQCDAGEIGGAVGKTLPVGTYARAAVPGTLSSTTSHRYTYDTNMVETTKYCAEGNLYVEGTLNGRVTVSSAQSIIATGDIVLAGGRNGDDMLGVVATNTVEVYHPRLVEYRVQYKNSLCGDSGTRTYRYCPYGSTASVAGWPTRYSDPTTGSNNPVSGIQVAGSIQTLQHSFLVQKYNEGPSQGKLVVFGSIAQRWRGIVGTGSGSGMTGYAKLYQYDRRLIYSPPPYFPRWTNSQWSLRYSGEITNPPAVKVP